MIRLKSSATAAVLAMSGIVIAQAPFHGKHSFSSTLISSALSRFHAVKVPGQGNLRSVVTAIRVDPPQQKDDQGPIKADVLPKKDGPPPTVPVKQDNSKPVVPKQDEKKPTPGPAAGTNTVPAPATTMTTAPPAIQQAIPGTVTNSFTGEDIHSAINQVGLAAGVTIITDDSIKDQSITIDFKNDPIEVAINKLAMMVGAYWKQQSPGFYVISKATPDASMFTRFAESKVYITKNQNAATIQALLSASYKSYISVDPKTNQIGVTAPKQLLDKILSDIAQIDRPGRQVSVEAQVTEITVDDALQTGFSWAKGHVGMSSDLAITYTQAAVSDLAMIDAAITNHKMTLRANPHLIATAGQEATINVGQDTYYSLLSGSTIYPTSQIQLIHTGVVLKFTAIVGDDGMITMQLDPSVSDAVVSVNGNPTSNIRTASTRLTIKSGQTIIIAGLIQDTGSKQTLRVPFLGYLPLIGEIFTQRTNDKKRVETVFLITPKLIQPQ
jgi:type II secretory pathway component GspD/PulD (secretin)